MQKQKKQFVILIVILLLAVGGYFLAAHISEKEAADSESDTESYALTTLDSASVNKLSFTNTSGTYTFHKDGDDWISDDDTSLDMDEASIDSMVAILASLGSEDRIDQVDDLTKYGLDVPSKKLLVSDGKTTVTILVGAENTAISKYYVCLENDQTTVYTMDNSSVVMFDKTLEDCIAEPETTEEETETVQTEDVTGTDEKETAQTEDVTGTEKTEAAQTEDAAGAEKTEEVQAEDITSTEESSAEKYS